MLDQFAANPATQITSAEAAAIKALAEIPASRADVAFVGDEWRSQEPPTFCTVTPEQVALALRGPWRVTFTPHISRQTIGDIRAVYNPGQADEFAFTASVNLDAALTLDHFVAAAKAAKAKRDAEAPAKNAARLASVESLLNAE
jgi:hypothetical protein